MEQGVLLKEELLRYSGARRLKDQQGILTQRVLLKEQLLRYSRARRLKDQLRYIEAKGIAKRAASKV